MVASNTPEPWDGFAKALEPFSAQYKRMNAVFLDAMQPQLTAVTQSISRQMVDMIRDATVLPKLGTVFDDMAGQLAKSAAWETGARELFANFATAHQAPLQAVLDSIRLNASEWIEVQGFVETTSTQLDAADAGHDDDASPGRSIDGQLLFRFGVFLLVLAYGAAMMVPTAAAGDITRLQEQSFAAGTAMIALAIWVRNSPK